MFIVIELWPDLESAAIVVDPDSGKNLVFTIKEDAEAVANDCQHGIVVPATSF
jgi:hypothetical protein